MATTAALEDAVAEEYCRKGIAAAQVEKRASQVRCGGVHVILVHADNRDEPAVALCTKLGVQEEVMRFGMSTTESAD